MLFYNKVVQCTDMWYYYFIITFIIIRWCIRAVRRGTRCSRLSGVAEVYDRINGHNAYYIHTVLTYI